MSDLSVTLIRIAASVIAMSELGCAVESGGGHCDQPDPHDVLVGADVACAIATSPYQASPYFFDNDFCAAVCASDVEYCTLPPEYAALASAGDAGGEAGTDAPAPTCPEETAKVKVTCTPFPGAGRRTAGLASPAARGASDVGDLGAYFADCAYLEEVSVHAFARLAAELEMHGAPRALIDAALRAERDEVRHARTCREIARRFGAEPLHVEPPRFASPRSLFDIALENAIEGCVRETFGAVFGLVQAARVRDRRLAAQLRSIALDECEHAALGWRIAAWALPKLTTEERARVADEMRAAASELATHDASPFEERLSRWIPGARERRAIVRLLEREVLRAA